MPSEPPNPQPSANEPPMLALLARARTGDEAAIAELLAHCLPRVRGLSAIRMGHTLVDLHDFDDIVQETMLAALRGLDRCEARTEGAFVGWLASIVESRLLDARRHGQAEKRGGGAVQRRADLGVTTLSSLAGADAARSPSQDAADAEIDPRLERALLGLGAPMREIIYRKLVLDMSHAEIAAALGFAGADSSRAMFHKGLGLLRQRLEGPAAD